MCQEFLKRERMSTYIVISATSVVHANKHLRNVLVFNTQEIGKRDLFIFIILYGCDVIRILKLCIEERGVSGYLLCSVQFESSNDVTPSAINMKRSSFPIY